MRSAFWKTGWKWHRAVDNNESTIFEVHLKVCSKITHFGGSNLKRFQFLGAVAMLAFGAFGVQAQDKDIVDTAVAAGSFNTLVAAVKAAGLVDTLKGAGPFTVFAPTDAAFAKIPKATLDGLLANPEKLKKVLLYHVLSGKVMAADVKTMKAPTVQGSSANIMVSPNGVMIDKAKVVKTDIVCSNGVIHVIDTVIMPKK